MAMTSVKKIALFGATGNTGQAILASAVEHGYEVTVLVRDPSKLPPGVKVCRIVQGDVLNADVVETTVKGQDAVIVALGTRNDLSPTTMLSEGLKNIVAAMEKHGVKRISCIISSFLFWERSKVPAQYKDITEDHERMYEVIKASQTEWIAAFPPHIADEPARGNYVLRSEAPVGRVITKQDLAEIMIKVLTMDEYVGHVIGMGYLPTEKPK
ncbi:flavin reductase (NADPH)-like [Ornithodoros turicata]|uniref:flavin reductase (NADPH)-like n=1 Tax=Ornithodoros turicata TaxID=34597 RepID=UPI003138AF80